MKIKINKKYFNQKRLREFLLLIIIVFAIMDVFVIKKILKKYEIKIVETTQVNKQNQEGQEKTQHASSPTSEKTREIKQIKPQIPMEKINKYYSKKGDAIFGFGKKIPNIDAKTFQTFKEVGNYIWSRDQNNIYIGIKNQGKTIILPGADPETFEVLNQNYFKDDTNVFYIDTIIQTADTQTFKTINHFYAKDNTYIFFKDRIVKNADPTSFKLLENGYAQDQNNIFFEGKLLTTNQDFELLEEGYAKDNKTIFFGGEAIQANKDTFEVINKIRAKDDTYMYIQGEIVPDILAKYFVYMTPQYIKSPNGVYYVSKNGSTYSVTKMPEADPYTFQPVMFLGMFDAQDKNNFYKNGKITKGF